ncbi:DUF406 family protein, partial [Escherichia coli]|uniref:DUF406 family protein n=1 Tax=Escherichia coli TaxID=562 RepID=UPI00207B55BC
SLQGKISSDGCLKKEQMVVSAIASTPQSSADEGASVAYKIKDLEGQVELDAAFTFSCQAEMIIFELSLRSLA